MDLKSLGEFGLIEVIKKNFKTPEGILGIGDDCAVIPQHDGFETLVSTDMLVEGSHFLIDDIPPYNLGWKSAAVNISDIAAMGGRPTGTFLSIALPCDLKLLNMDEFIRGYRDISEKYSCPLLGGDTTSSPDRLSICVTIIGECPAGFSRKRSAAQAGDLICVTGFLGDSAGGLQIVLKRQAAGKGAENSGRHADADTDLLISRHYLPEPRVGEGIELAATEGVHAMMDISDGIGSDLRHILKASGRGAVVDINAVPVSDELKRTCRLIGADPLDLAISGGEDYELLFTISREAEKTLKVKHFTIGEITAAPGIIWKGGNKDYNGFTHF